MPRYECRIARVDADMTTFHILSRMGWVATKLYNTALWHARDTWDRTGKIPTGFDLQRVVFESSYHGFMPAHTYQHPAHQVGMAFRSWYRLRKKDRTSRPPGFRKKEVGSSFMVDAFKILDERTILMTIGPSLREELIYPQKRMTLRLRWNTPLPEGGEIKQLQFVPRNGYFEVHAKILLPEPVWKIEGQTVAIDLGMRNPIVSVGEDDIVSIYKGGAILAAKRYWNKEKARVQREIMVRSDGERKWSKVLGRMTKRSGRQVKQMVHAMTSTFVKDCIKRDVKEVVVGDLVGIKKNNDGTGKRWNKKLNQNWQQFPIRMLVAQLDYKLARHGIRLIEQDESGTSRGRCGLCGCTDREKLHRKHRGMFLCENCGTTQNADTNGARNQLARYLRRETKISTGSSGCLAQPMVYRWDDHRWSTAVVG